ncbi:NACHT domain-containing protein, partial [Streptomyces longispororuber]|uniref:NACHT domain-containing protein n=1 Tax=Streptomyces longispororuber TaxID=68230 RepID=UPI00210A18B1
TFHGPVVQARHVDITYAAAAPSHRERLVGAVGGAVFGALAVLLALGHGADLVRFGTAARWLTVAGCLAAAVLLPFLPSLRVRRERRIATAPVAVARLDAAARSLADMLTAQYAGEERHARIGDPMALPVRWRAAEPDLADHPVSLLPETGGADHVPVLEGEFLRIAEQYDALPRRRLAILGGPGAGKSVLVVRLARELLRRRTGRDAEPVPVVLPLASWNPRETPSVWWWAAGELAQAHPSAVTVPGAARRTVAHRLITSGRVLPVLDGFDELPASARVDALRQLRSGLHGDVPLVLTSRVAAYRDAMRQGDVRLPGMAAVELRPLDVEDVRGYLLLSARPGADHRSKWDPVLTALTDGDTAQARRLRGVLRTPLMVAMARVVYSDTSARPAELLDTEEFPTARAVRRHLLSSFVDAAYAPDGDAPDHRRRWTPRQARHWLAQLAAEERRTGRRDIAWWRLERMLPRGALLLLVLPVAAAAALAVDTARLPWADGYQDVPVPRGAVAALLVAAAAVVGRYGVRRDALVVPQRLVRPGPRDVLASVRQFTVPLPFTLGALALLLPSFGVAAALGVLIAVWILHAMGGALRRPADPEAHGPLELLRADRRTVLTLGLVPAAPAGAGLRFPLGAVGVLAGAVLVWGRGLGRDVVEPAHWFVLAATALVAAAALGFAASAWGRYCLARTWLALSGRMPWQPMSFLQDAHRRGVLQRTGAFYRFRHLELRNELAAAPRSETGPALELELRQRSRLRMPDRQRITAALAALVAGPAAFVLLAGALGGPPAAGPVRALAPACTLLTEHDLRGFLADPVRVPRDPRPGVVLPAAGSMRSFAVPTAGSSGCTYTEGAALRPEAWIGVGVGFTAAVDRRSSSSWADEWARSPTMWGGAKAVSGIGDTAFEGTRPVPGEDPVLRAKTPAYTSPMGRVRASADNMVVTVDVSLEFATEAQVLDAARLVARTVLHNAGRLGPPGPGERTLRDAVVPRAPGLSRFGLYDAKAAGRLTGATWAADDPSSILGFHSGYFWLALRLPRGTRCDGAGAGSFTDDVTCTADTPDGPVRLTLAVHDCGGACTTRERDDFYADRPAPYAGSLSRHDAHTRFRVREAADGGATAHLVRGLRSWWRTPTWNGRKNTARRPLDFYLWLRVTTPPGQRALAEKVINDAYRQRPADGA